MHPDSHVDILMERGLVPHGALISFSTEEDAKQMLAHFSPPGPGPPGYPALAEVWNSTDSPLSA